MRLDELKAQIHIEFDQVEKVLTELQNLANEIGDSEPRIRDKTAAGAFLSQIYSGLENVLKRILKYHQVELPTGEDWHIQLLKIFHDGENKKVPDLLNDSLHAKLAPFRKFRHVILHSYGFELEWKRMLPGIQQAQAIFQEFKNSVEKHLKTLG